MKNVGVSLFMQSSGLFKVFTSVSHALGTRVTHGRPCSDLHMPGGSFSSCSFGRLLMLLASARRNAFRTSLMDRARTAAFHLECSFPERAGIIYPFVVGVVFFWQLSHS